jgi:hypothetical protein
MPDKPPVPWVTIRQTATECGLFAVVDEAMIGRKLTPARRRLIVGNIVMAVAKWRESFRDCGCWKTADGFALCDWHERAFRPQREEAERLAVAALREPAPTLTTTDAVNARLGGKP